MRNRRVKLDIPDNWHPIEGQPRTYCRDGDDTCRLQFHLFPPVEVEDDLVALRKLRQMVRERDPEAGHEIHFSHQMTTNGPVATSTYQSARKSVKQYWLIPCEVTILASYSTENIGFATAELEEAQRIIDSMQFVA